MPAADTARLVAELSLNDKQFQASIKNIDKGISRLGVRATALGTGIGIGVERIAEKGIGALFGAIQSGQESLHELQDIQAQTAAVIASTGGAAGVSAEQVREYASSLEDLTTADDKQIQNAENLLLTFTKIGDDVFPDATKAVVNMSIALADGDAASADFSAAAIQVGKALNDPIKGVTALSKVGVSFTEQQKKQIKTLVESGKVQEAQKVILAELATEFGKAGEAAGTSGAAGARRLNDAVEDLQVSLAQGLDPALTEIRDELGTALKDPKVQQGVRDLGRFLGEAATKGLAFAKSIPFDKVAEGLKAAAGFAGDLISAFANLPPEAQATIIALAGLNKLSGGAITGIIGELGKGLIKGVLGMNAGVVNINAATVNGAGGVPGAAPAAAGGASGVLGKVASIASKVFIVGIAAEAADLIHGAISPGGGLENRVQTGQQLPTDQLQWPFGPKNTPKVDFGPFENILGGDSGFKPVTEAVEAADSAAAARQNVTNERLEAIKGFAANSAAATTAAQSAQVAATQQAAAAQVHATERSEGTLAQRIDALNAQAAAAATRDAEGAAANVRAVERAEAIATQKANEQRQATEAAKAIATANSNAEQAAVARAAAAQVSAQNAQKAAVSRVADTVSELRGSVLKQKPPVVNVKVASQINLSGIGSNQQTFKQIFRTQS